MRVSDLRSTFQVLDQTLLPLLDETQPITKRSRIQIRSYVVLAHAELESYVEEAHLIRVDKIVARAKAGSPHNGLVTMGMRYAEQLRAQSHADIAGIAEACKQFFMKELINNHGVKEDNIAPKLKTLGVSMDRWQNDCAILISELNTFGSLRGKIAHVGMTGLKENPYPSNVRGITTNIIDELPNFHNLVTRI